MKRINIDNIYNELWDLLGMFESKSYVCEKVAINFPSIEVSELNKRVDIITSSVRQSREYFLAANNVSNLTSPLLVNYGMLNLAKALYYLTQKDISSNPFSKHGIQLKSKDYQSLSDVKLDIKKKGAILDLISCYDEKKMLESISILDLLSQIPELYQLFQETYNTYSKVLYAKPIKHGYKLFSTKRDKAIISKYITDNYDDIFTKGIHLEILPDKSDASFRCTKCIGGDLSDNLLRTNTSNSFINIEKSKLRYSQITISYLIIFAYSMLVRYQPNNWERFINNDFSKECQIITKSIQICKEEFIIEVTKLLLSDDIEILTKDDDKNDEELDYKMIYRKIKEEAKRDSFVRNGRI